MIAPCGKDFKDILSIKAEKQLAAINNGVSENSIRFAKDMAGAFIACCECQGGAVIVGCEFNSDGPEDK